MSRPSSSNHLNIVLDPAFKKQFDCNLYDALFVTVLFDFTHEKLNSLNPGSFVVLVHLFEVNFLSIVVIHGEPEAKGEDGSMIREPRVPSQTSASRMPKTLLKKTRLRKNLVFEWVDRD